MFPRQRPLWLSQYVIVDTVKERTNPPASGKLPTASSSFVTVWFHVPIAADHRRKMAANRGGAGGVAVAGGGGVPVGPGLGRDPTSTLSSGTGSLPRPHPLYALSSMPYPLPTSRSLRRGFVEVCFLLSLYVN